MLRSGRHALLFAALLFVFAFSTHEANAVGDARINVSGQSLNEIQLVLTDAQGNEVKQQQNDRDRAAGYWYFRNVPDGTYGLKVLNKNGQLVQPTTPQPRVVIRDGRTSSYRVDADTGAVTLISSLASSIAAHWSFGPLVGATFSPYNGFVESSALNSSGTTSLDGTWGLFGFEGRYYFNPAQQLAQQGLRLFVYGSYVHYFGSSIEKKFLDDHPTPGADVGAGVDQKWTGILGVGANLNIAQRLGLGLMLGAHMTRVETIALADETGGGGANNRFSRGQYVFGPAFAAELFYPICDIQGVGTVEWLARGQVMLMPDTSVDGRSSNNYDYLARGKGGAEGSFQTGFRVMF